MAVRQVDLEGRRLPIPVETSIRVAHKFKAPHFNLSILDEDLPDFHAMDDETLIHSVRAGMKAKPDVRSLSETTVREEAAALAAYVRNTKHLGVAP